MYKGLIALGAALMALAFAPEALANDFVVDDNLAQCPDAQYTSIQAAVLAAPAGETIEVCAGEYHEEVTIAGPAKNGLRVIANDKPENVVLDGIPCEAPVKDRCQLGFHLNDVSGVLIEGFTVREYHDNIVLDGADENVLKENVSTQTWFHDAFQLFDSHWNVIEDNEASMTAAPAGCGIDLIESSHNLVKSNLVFGNPNAGILLLFSGSGNVVTDNEVRENPRVLVSPGPPEVFSNGDGIRSVSTPEAVIQYNTVTQSGRHGVFVLGVGSTGVQVLDNVVRENGTLPAHDGIRLEMASNNQVAGNQSVRNRHDGVHLINAHDNDVVDNDILFNGTPGLANGCGVDVENGSSGNDILRNDLIGHSRAGIRLRGSGSAAPPPSSNLVADNDADKNPGYAILLEDATDNVVRLNEADDNGIDGLRANANSTGNVFERNAMANNGIHDCHDDSAGPFPPAGTANIWTSNEGKTQNRLGLCKDAVVTPPATHTP
jgi:parallel beta-helix repeat protein